MSPHTLEIATAFAREDRGVLAPPLHEARRAEGIAALPFEPSPEFLEWLRFCNGCCLTHGGTYGLKPRPPSRDIAEALKTYSSWPHRRWLPIAWDGFGNEYALDCHPSSPSTGEVWFFETTSSAEEPASRVASSFEEFLEFFFSSAARSGEEPPGASRDEA